MTVAAIARARTCTRSSVMLYCRVTLDNIFALLPSVLLRIGWRSTGPGCPPLILRCRAANRSPNLPPPLAPLPPPLSPPPPSPSPPFSAALPPFRTPLRRAARLLLPSTSLRLRWTCCRARLCLELVKLTRPCLQLFRSVSSLSSLCVSVPICPCPLLHSQSQYVSQSLPNTSDFLCVEVWVDSAHPAPCTSLIGLAPWRCGAWLAVDDASTESFPHSAEECA